MIISLTTSFLPYKYYNKNLAIGNFIPKISQEDISLKALHILLWSYFCWHRLDSKVEEASGILPLMST
jgi:hypothetical protein